MFGHIFVGFLTTMFIFYLLSCVATILYRACKEHSKYLETARMTRAIDARKNLLENSTNIRSQGSNYRMKEQNIDRDKKMVPRINQVVNEALV